MKIANPFERFDIKVANYDDKENYGLFVIYPLERGFGLTIGNALRRVLLSALPGASIFAVEVEGAAHEFTSLDGVQEDVTSIILNLKDVIFQIDEFEEGTKKLTINKVGPCTVTAADIDCPAGASIVNKDAVIAHLAEGGKLNMTLHARNGRGFVTGEQNKLLHPGLPVGVIATDSNYSPVIKVNYSVDNARVGNDSRFDKLTLEVWTNGSMTPQKAVALAAQFLVLHLQKFANLEAVTKDINNIEKEEEAPVEEVVENINIEDLDLSQRSYNCLKRADIHTLLELSEKTESEMIKMKNLGKKSLKEIRDILAENGLSFKEEIQ